MRARVLGVLLSYLLILVKLVITLLFTPFLIQSLGIEVYGLYALVGALAAYLYILDFGMNDSIIRFFMKHEDDPIQRDKFLSEMLCLYLALGVLILLSTLGIRQAVAPVFGVQNTPQQVDLLRDMILITGGAAAVLVALNPVGALLSATESFVFLRTLEIVATAIATITMVAVLHTGGGAVHVVAIAAISTAGQGFVRLGYAIVVLRARVRLRIPDRIVLGRVTWYAAPIFVAMIAEVIFWRLDSILIGAMLGAAPVAVFAIGVTFNKYFMSFATALSRVMTPEIIRKVDRGTDARVLTEEMIRISRIQAMFLLPILSALVIFGQRFLVLWLGSEFAYSYWIMIAVLVPYTFELTGNARNIILQVKGLYWHKSAITLALAILNVPLTLFLLQAMGVVGAAVSTGIAIMAAYGLIAVLLKLKLDMEMGRYWVQTGRGIVPVAAVLTTGGLWIERFLPDGWLALAGGGIAYAAMFGILTYLFAASHEERARITRFTKSLRFGGRRYG